MGFFDFLSSDDNTSEEEENNLDLEAEQLRIKQTLSLYGDGIKEDIKNFVILQQLQNVLKNIDDSEVDKLLEFEGVKEHKEQLLSLRTECYKHNTLQSFFESFSEGDVVPDTTFKVIVSENNKGFKTFTILD